MRVIFPAAILLLLVNAASPQETGLFIPIEVQEAYKKGTRSPDGRPGPDYWQNHARYRISAELIPEERTVIGSADIKYHNESPDTLDRLQLKLLQDLYKVGSKKDREADPAHLHHGMEILECTLNGRRFYKDDKRDPDLPPSFRAGKYMTILYLFIPADPVMPGGTADIHIEWKYRMPPRVLLRTGPYDSTSFFVGYWFPQMAVYDDITGWDNHAYSGIQETYNDYADYEVEIKVPGEYLVWATGEQVNEDQLFEKTYLSRIRKSRQTEDTITIVGREDLGKGILKGEKLFRTWKFVARNVPDFTWAASDHFLWDATSLEVEAGEERKRVWVNSAYPDNRKDYSAVVGYAKESIRYLSEEFPGVPFPYPRLTIFHGKQGGGMEFPMMVNNSHILDTALMMELTSHEIAHTYFPFYVMTNERLYAWMDEGWVSLFGHSFVKKLGYGSSRTFLDHTSGYEGAGGRIYDAPLVVPSMMLNRFSQTNHYYIRPVQASAFLMEIMQEKGVGNPLPAFIEAWAGKHPVPADFFNMMNGLAGENLSWFWEPWYYQYGYPDLGIGEVDFDGEQLGISVERKGRQPVPVVLTLIFEDGTQKKVRSSIQTWKDGRERHILQVESGREPVRIMLGNEEIPDVRHGDNTWPRK